MTDTEIMVKALKSAEPSAAAESPVIAVTKKNDPEEPEVPQELSVLPVRGMVVFPGTVVPLSVRRASSLQMLDDTLPKTKIIALLTQRNEQDQAPAQDGLYTVGVAGNVLKLIRQADDVVVILVQAIRRIRAKKFVKSEPYFRCEVEVLRSQSPDNKDQQ